MAEPVTISFEDEEQEVMRFLAKRFHAGNSGCKTTDIPLPNGFDDKWLWSTIQRLNNYGMVDRKTNIHIDIKPKLLEAVERLNNPETPNYWKKAIEWWFSTRWRAAATIVAVILPLLVQWIEMIRTVLRWMSLDAG